MKTLMKTLTFKDYPHYVGLDRILEHAAFNASQGSYPPYNVINNSDDQYTVEIAVAGFAKDDLTIEEHNGELIIRGEVAGEEEKTYLHKGISSRKFERVFTLADHVHVTDAVVENGLLSVSLVREVPEELKPRTIAIDFKS